MHTSLIQSSFKYCLSNIGWVTPQKKNLTTVQRLQNRTARAVFGNFNFSYSVSTIISNLHWMPIQEDVSLSFVSVFTKCLHGKAPAYLTGMYPVPILAIPVMLLSITYLYTPYYTLSLFNQIFIDGGSTFWNSLPFHIKQTDDKFYLEQKLKF